MSSQMAALRLAYISLSFNKETMRFQNPFDLLHAPCRILDRAKHERYHHTVEGGIGKRQVLNGSLGQADRHRCLPHTLSRIGQHGAIRLNRLHLLDPFWVVPGKVQPGPRSHLQDRSIRLARGLLAKWIGETALRTETGISLIECGKARMKDLSGLILLCRIALLGHLLCSFSFSRGLRVSSRRVCTDSRQLHQLDMPYY